MNRFATLLLLAASAGLLVGCGDKPAPIIEARPIDKPPVGDSEWKTPTKPERSDPDARKLLDEMLAAHTDGKPEQLAALKECKFTRKGQQEGATGRFTATWTRHLSWPTGYRLQCDLDFGNGVQQHLLFASGPSGAWQAAVGAKEKSAIGGDEKANVTAQMQEDALTLLFPFADPGVVVSKADGKDPTVIELHAWAPTSGYVRLGIDAKTKLLARLSYTGRELTASVLKELTFQEYKEFAGVKLATKVGVGTKAKLLGEWTELTLDAAKPDPKLFDGP